MNKGGAGRGGKGPRDGGPGYVVYMFGIVIRTCVMNNIYI